jgi:hypothetical protein
MRKLTDHICSPANAALDIAVVDEPGQGNASHLYDISGMDHSRNLAGRHFNIPPSSLSNGHAIILFQNGPIKDFGVNGITEEALLAIVIDRLRSFQSGPFSCRENAISLTHCEDALMWLQKRTRSRMARGVEGTNQK